MVCLSSAGLFLLCTTYRHLIPAPALCWHELKEHMDLSRYWRYPATVYRCPSSSLKKNESWGWQGGGGKPALTGGNLESSDYPFAFSLLLLSGLNFRCKIFCICHRKWTYTTTETSYQNPLGRGRWVKK